jgi:hypothetical protein
VTAYQSYYSDDKIQVDRSFERGYQLCVWLILFNYLRTLLDLEQLKGWLLGAIANGNVNVNEMYSYI